MAGFKCKKPNLVDLLGFGLFGIKPGFPKAQLDGLCDFSAGYCPYQVNAQEFANL